MPSAAVIQIADLLNPLPGDNPAGADLRADPDSEFFDLKSRRSEARTLEDRQSGTPDWPGVVKAATNLLAKKSKDLDVLAWLIESLTRVHRFAGLRDGLIVAREIIGKFWETMSPPFDPEDMSQRLRVFGGLTGSGSGSLLPPLRLIALVEGSLTDPPGTPDRPAPLSMFAYTQAKGIGKASFESATALVHAASDSYLRNSFDDVKQSRTELDALEKTLTEKCEQASISAISFEPIGRVLDEVADTYLEMGGGRISAGAAGGSTGASGSDEQTRAAETGSPGRSPAGFTGGTELKSRKQAIAEIRRLANYFESAEPQGVIGPALQRVANWGEMPLGDLLRTFVPEAEHRKMFSWLGIEPKPEASSD